MTDNFLGEIRLFPYPNINQTRGWVPCMGQVLPIQQYAALYSLIGVQFGGNGTTTFALPNLCGRVLAGSGAPGYVQGGPVGTELADLSASQLPAHNHSVNASLDTDTASDATGSPANDYPGTVVKIVNDPIPVYVAAPTNPTSRQTLNPIAVTNTGGSQKHENRQPFIALVPCIATQGIYPPRP